MHAGRLFADWATSAGSFYLDWADFFDKVTWISLTPLLRDLTYSAIPARRKMAATHPDTHPDDLAHLSIDVKTTVARAALSHPRIPYLGVNGRGYTWEVTNAATPPAQVDYIDSIWRPRPEMWTLLLKAPGASAALRQRWIDEMPLSHLHLLLTNPGTTQVEADLILERTQGIERRNRVNLYEAAWARHPKASPEWLAGNWVQWRKVPVFAQAVLGNPRTPSDIFPFLDMKRHSTKIVLSALRNPALPNEMLRTALDYSITYLGYVLGHPNADLELLEQVNAAGVRSNINWWSFISRWAETKIEVDVLWSLTSTWTRDLAQLAATARGITS